MNEEFMKNFGWIGDILNQELHTYYDTKSIEYKILKDLKDQWGKQDGITMLKRLDDTYGSTVLKAVAHFLKINILKAWKKTGEKEAHEGIEIDDFIRLLWVPLKDTGFEYTYKKEDNKVTFHVTKCPVFDLAEKTGMHQWFYHLACVTDFYSTPAFSSNIGFSRLKTLIQGDECCDHAYFYKSQINNDTLLGYCGLFCGNCPNYQKTMATVPVNFKKNNFSKPCLGCNNELNIKTVHCSNCAIMECNKKKNIRICYECTDFPCEMMNNFINDSRYPYHKDVENNMKLLKEKGLNEWVVHQEDKYTCSRCKRVLNFFQTECGHCGTGIE